MDWQDRIEHKLDQVHEKLDSYSTRLARTETSVNWLKWALSILLTVASVGTIALAKYIP